jgi:hypothetical protein
MALSLATMEPAFSTFSVRRAKSTKNLALDLRLNSRSRDEIVGKIIPRGNSRQLACISCLLSFSI